MSTKSNLHAALQPFQRRAVVARCSGGAVIALLMAIIFAELGGVWHVGGPLVWASLALVALAASVANALIRRPNRLDLARRVDTRAHLNDLVVSALSCEGDGMASLVRSRALVALQNVAQRDVYPLERPRHWRSWLFGAVAAQAVVLGFAWQAPAARTRVTSVTARTSGGVGSTETPAPEQGPDATTQTPSLPVNTPATPASAVQPPMTNGIASRADAAKTRAGAAAANAEGRARLAIARAGEELRAGRVPMARRAIVERYFAALSSQRSAQPSLRKPRR